MGTKNLVYQIPKNIDVALAWGDGYRLEKLGSECWKKPIVP
jgi:hypothetical protein